MKERIKKNKLLLRLLFFVLIFIILGFFYVAILSKSNKDLIQENLNTFFHSLNTLNYNRAFLNCFLSNSFYTIFIWLLGISIIGIPIIILILIMKSFILGFSISSILYFYKWKGILISIFYIIPLILNLFALFYLSYYAIIFSKNLIGLLFMKKEINFRNVMKKYAKILLFTFIMILGSSVVEIYLIPAILKLLQI